MTGLILDFQHPRQRPSHLPTTPFHHISDIIPIFLFQVSKLIYPAGNAALGGCT